MEWQIVNTLASVVSALAIVAGTIFVVYQLRQESKDREFAVGSSLFEIWQSRDFQDDQLLLLHKLPVQTWDDFVAMGRGSELERAFRRVAGFYDRVGHLIVTGIIDQNHILPTIGADALAVWQRIEPLVRQARRTENPTLFQCYEAVLPSCIECAAPLLANQKKITSADSLPNGKQTTDEVERISVHELKRMIDAGTVAVLDVNTKPKAEKIIGALRAEPNELSGWLSILPRDKPVVVYCS